MSLAGFICDAEDLPVTIEACLACARSGALPGCHQTVPVLTGIVQGLRPDTFGWTVTTLIGCVRKTRLMRQTAYRLKPSQAYWAYRGQLLHGVAARYAADDPQVIAEQRFTMVINLPNGESITISGQPDLVLLDQHKLIDYKTVKAVPTGWHAYVCPETDRIISEGPYALRRKSLDCPHCRLGSHHTKTIEVIGPPRAKPHHVLQLSLYRLLLARNGITIDRGVVLYLDMATQCRIPVDLLSIEDAERYLRERVALAMQPDLPPILTDLDEVWQCDWCPVRAACEERYGGPVGKAAHDQSTTQEEP